MEAQLLDTEAAKRAYVEEHGAGNEQALSRLHMVCGHLVAFPCSAVEAPGEQPTKTVVRKGPRTITITDSETNKTISRTRTAHSRSGALMLTKEHSYRAEWRHSCIRSSPDR